jgi:hypothetical protein
MNGLTADGLIDNFIWATRRDPPADKGFPAPDGPTAWVGAMYVIKGAADLRQDHLWGPREPFRGPGEPGHPGRDVDHDLRPRRGSASGAAGERVAGVGRAGVAPVAAFHRVVSTDLVDGP